MTNNFVERYVLQKNEKILWEGRPKSIKFFEEPHTTLIIIRWAISITLIACAFKYFSYAQTISIESEVKIGATLFLVFCGVMTAVRPFLNIRNLEKRINYIITDKRVIAYRKRNSEAAIVQSRDLKDFTEATVILKDNNLGDLYIGPKTGSASRCSRRDLPPVQRDGDYILPLVFCNIFMPQEAAASLPDFINVKNSGKKNDKKAA